MSERKSIFLFVLMFLLLLCSGCNGENDSEDNNSNPEETKMVEGITEMENSLLEIMQQADLAPVVESEMESDDEEKEKEKEKEEEGEENKLTFEETILGEILEREMGNGSTGNGTIDEELPESIEELWDNIKMTITDLHEQWDELEPILIRDNISDDLTDGFNEVLDGLTVLSIEQDYLGVISNANQLTWYFSKFREPFTETYEVVAYEAKFHVRNIVIKSSTGNIEEARKSIDYLNSKRPVLTDTMEKEDAEELESSISNLERAVENENPEIVKIKAALVMESLVQILSDTDS